MAAISPSGPRGRALGLIALMMLAWCLPAQGSEPAAGYELTIRNTNIGQNFSPPVMVLHTPEYGLFELGEPATVELWRLAEDGSTAEFQALADPAVRAVIVGRPVHRRDSPVFTTVFEAPPDLLISVGAMLSLTNDGFVAARSIALPAKVGASATVALRAYDAGSEANTESCAHVPCEIHDQRMTEGAEGVVRDHGGIRGDADIAMSRGWDGSDLGTLTITRLR
jgi:Spondin_N